MINKIQNSLKPNNNQFNERVNKALEFNKVLQNVQNSQELKISSHAMDRLKERDINLTSKDMIALNGAVKKIRQKGGKEALIIYNNVAFITSIKNNTVITAVDSKSLKENIFTNIDSAVIL